VPTGIFGVSCRTLAQSCAPTPDPRLLSSRFPGVSPGVDESCKYSICVRLLPRAYDEISRVDTGAADGVVAYSVCGCWSLPQNGHSKVPSSAEVAPSSGNCTSDRRLWRSRESKTRTTRLQATHGMNRVSSIERTVAPPIPGTGAGAGEYADASRWGRSRTWMQNERHRAAPGFKQGRKMHFERLRRAVRAR
jgi:hypothetical protein